MSEAQTRPKTKETTFKAISVDEEFYNRYDSLFRKTALDQCVLLEGRSAGKVFYNVPGDSVAFAIVQGN